MVAKKTMLQKRKAPDQSPPQVYVSSSPRDSKQVESIIHRLQREGIQIGSDLRKAEAGEPVDVRLLAAREASKIWLVFVGAGGSEGIQAQEYAEAQERLQRAPGDSFRLIPLLLRGAAWEDAPTFLRPFSGFQISDLDRESEWLRLVEGLKKALSGVAGRTPPTGHAYVSYSTRNILEAEPVVGALLKKGARLWFDRYEVLPGDSWPEAISAARAAGRVWLGLIGRRGVGTTQFEEFREAQERLQKEDFRVIPALLPGASREYLPTFLQGSDVIQFQSLDDQDALDQILEKLNQPVDSDSSEPGARPRRLQGHDETVWCLAFSPDGKLLASGGGDGKENVRVWSLVTNETTVLPIPGAPSEAVNDLDFHPETKALACGTSDGSVVLWRIIHLTSSKLGLAHLRRFSVTKGSVLAVRFSPDGNRLIVGTNDGRVLVYDWETQGEALRIDRRGETAPIQDMSFNETMGWVAFAGGVDVDIYFFNVFGPEKAAHITTIKGLQHASVCVDFSPDGTRLAIGDRGGRVKIVSLDDLPATAVLPRPASPEEESSNSPASTSSSSLHAASSSSASSPSNSRVLAAHSSSVQAVAFSPDGHHLASAALEGPVLVWDVNTGEEAARFEEHRGAVHSLTYSPDGKWLAAAGDDGVVRLWPAHKLRETQQVAGPTLEFARDPNRLATFLARLTLRHRSALALAESPSPALLRDALRAIGAVTAAEVIKLERELEPGFQPDRLWLAWVTKARRGDLEAVQQDLEAFVRENGRPEIKARAVPRPAQKLK